MNPLGAVSKREIEGSIEHDDKSLQLHLDEHRQEELTQDEGKVVIHPFSRQVQKFSRILGTVSNSKHGSSSRCDSPRNNIPSLKDAFKVRVNSAGIITSNSLSLFHSLTMPFNLRYSLTKSLSSLSEVLAQSLYFSITGTSPRLLPLAFRIL